MAGARGSPDRYSIMALAANSTAVSPTNDRAATIAQLAYEASIEINVHDIGHLQESRGLLPAGKAVYVSYLPKQQWSDTEAACRAVRDAGFRPVPHVPVRLLPDAATADRVLGGFVAAQVDEVLLISGDYPQAVGPYTEVLQVLNSGVLQRHGLRRVSVAGHPEGHPKVRLEDIRRAELDKARMAQQAGLELTLLTQFFFEQGPFLDWVRELRSTGVRARVVGGLAGPTKLSTLIKFAMRCGAGASMRVLTARPAAFTKLLGDHGPESVISALAQARLDESSDFAGVHLFCFGGFVRTCRWLQAIAEGRFILDDAEGFRV
jgi:methylenetetrahydrofolate reductase (NADPH)